MANYRFYVLDKDDHVRGTPIERFLLFLKRTDWVSNALEDLFLQYPSLREKCHADAGIAAGSVNDAEFNGHVYSCKSAQGVGYVITLPIEAMPLISHASEMLTLLADLSLCDTLGGALSKALWKKREPRLLRLRRRMARFFGRYGRYYLAGQFSARLGWEFGMMFDRYVHLGTGDTPDIINEVTNSLNPRPPRREVTEKVPSRLI